MKQTIGSILAAVDRDDRSRQVAAKAVALARMSGARLELFHCDAAMIVLRRSSSIRVPRYARRNIASPSPGGFSILSGVRSRSATWSPR